MKDKQPLEYTNIVYTTKLYHQVGVVDCEEFIQLKMEPTFKNNKERRIRWAVIAITSGLTFFHIIAAGFNVRNEKLIG